MLTMDSSTANVILALHRDLQSWTQPFWFEMNNIKLDLSLAIGPKASTPPGSEQYQPEQYPVLGNNKQTTSRFRFDPKYYCGEKDENRLVNDVCEACVGSLLYRNSSHEGVFRSVRLTCSFGKPVKKKVVFKDECFLKANTKIEPTKMRRNSPFLRMPDHKLRNTKRNYTSSYLSGNTQRHVLDPQVPALRRTTGHRCLGPKSKCGVFITLLMCRKTGDWYLSCNGSLAHVLHVQKHALEDVVSPSKIEDED